MDAVVNLWLKAMVCKRQMRGELCMFNDQPCQQGVLDAYFQGGKFSFIF